MTLETLYRRLPSWMQSLSLNAYALRVHHHRYGPRLRREIEAARERETWPLHRLREYQDERLRSIVRAAWEGSSFYRDRWRALGIDPGEIRGVDDVTTLPLLTKEDVRAHEPEMMTAGGPRRSWVHGHTSGTTGTPLGVWYDRRTCVVTNAMDLRQKAWGGMRRGDWLGLFLGRVIVSPERDRPPFWQANHVQKQVWFSSFHLGEENLPHYVREIRRRKLRFLEGYPSTLFILARYLQTRGETLPMQAAFTSSETLHETQRHAIETALEAPIFDFYGHAERTVFATECEVHHAKHLAEDFGYVEVVDAAGDPVPDGEAGYLVGTSLHNRAMPMIRYRTGDVSRIVRGACPCGRTHRRIASVTTKAEDIVVTPDGRLISPSILTHPFKPFHSLRASQIVQEAPDRLRVLLVPSDDFGEEDRRHLRRGLEERLGAGVSIEFEIVDEIPREASGKFRWVISRVAHGAALDWSGAAPEGGPE
jgi:phenylacetate-CoA ligase